METHQSNEYSRTSSLSAEEVIRFLMGREVAGLVRNDPLARRGEDPEGVHQLRVSARRLRSELQIVAPAFTPDSLHHFRDELRWLGSTLGRQRDLDVLLSLLVSTSKELSTPLDSSVLAAIVDQRIGESRKVAAALTSKRYRRLVGTLSDAVVEPPLRKTASLPASDVFRAGLNDTLSTLFRTAQECGAQLASEDLHRIRIMAKRGRYSSEIASLYLGERATNIAESLSKVQDILGDFHDHVGAISYLLSIRTVSDTTGSTVDRSWTNEAISWLRSSNESLKAAWRTPLEAARQSSVEVLD